MLHTLRKLIPHHAVKNCVAFVNKIKTLKFVSAQVHIIKLEIKNATRTQTILDMIFIYPIYGPVLASFSISHL